MITIGRVIKPHGVKGELKVFPETDDINRFNGLKEIFIGEKTYKITSVRTGGNFVYLKTDEINDMDAAEKLRNKEIAVTDSCRVKLQKGRYFVRDLIGALVVGDNEEIVGEILNIENFGAADVITVKAKDKILRFPYLNKVVKEVDTDNKTMTVIREEFNKVCVYED